MAPFEEKHRSYFDFQRRTGDLPVQKEGEEVDYRGLLHRDGSVLMSVSLNQLKTPELFYRSLAAKLVLGMPFKEICHGYLKLENTLLKAQLLVLKILKICDFGYSKVINLLSFHICFTSPHTRTQRLDNKWLLIFILFIYLFICIQSSV
ncbi:4-hydroxy-3-methylbut-2-en-1-yl diphosphate synthase (ferredoxin), chloroplastic isoform X1 [Helianthus annuus]|uniref:4-hydroxy-3-methylbut-2-en-1-yl diphosphate synthase (ferredoxin), chloroplastic isoform X1 n=1 Tax=Helianthus annuus TaxID=4232 RepID=UPI001653205D|nr:4-hydroxy-3-methylbut-2-en-1-yl diphosphate synthase (ferredoxin), chloroplastic isoform X1 [Helianthus annuus]